MATHPSSDDDDPWAAFGPDDDEDDDHDAGEDDDGDLGQVSGKQPPLARGSQQQAAAVAVRVALALTQLFLKSNPNLPLTLRRVAILDNDCREDKDGTWILVLEAALRERGMLVTRLDHHGRTEAQESLSSGDTLQQQPLWFDAVIIPASWQDQGISNHAADGVEDGNSASDKRRIGSSWEEFIHDHLVPGGILLLIEDSSSPNSWTDSLNSFRSNSLDWNHRSEIVAPAAAAADAGGDGARIHVFEKRCCRIQTKTCPWLPRTATPPLMNDAAAAMSNADSAVTPGQSSHGYSLVGELLRLEQATIVVAAQERQSGRLTEHSIQSAVAALQSCGYCILSGLLYSQRQECLEWGRAVLGDLHQAAQILQERERIDLYHPVDSLQNPASYKELSMREDCRMDVRDGPRLQELRKKQLNAVAGSRLVNFRQLQAGPSSAISADSEFFCGHADLLEIVGRTMNPKDDDLYMGNFGRHNFSGGGPDGSFQDLRVGPVGGIVSLPGAADQAMHADTPHLFEHLSCLPAHYINAFTPGCAANDTVGQTAFVHGSHRLNITAQYFGKDSTAAGDDLAAWKHSVVRPSLDVGDVLLFDCRILHFGLANISNDIERPLLYTNMVMHWFHDPKNWDNERPIFET